MEQNQQTPPAQTDAWADVPTIDLASEAAKLGATPVQDYGSNGGDIPPAGQPQPAPAPGSDAASGAAAEAPAPGTTGVKKQTAAQAAKMTIDLIDHLQANAFSLFADDESERFKFDGALRNDLGDYLAIGIEESGNKFRMPWYIPFAFVLLISLFANFRTMRKLRKEKREEEAERRRLEEERQPDAIEMVRPPAPRATPPPATERTGTSDQPLPPNMPAEAVRALHQTAREGVELVERTKALPKCAFPTCNFPVKHEGDKYCTKRHYEAHRAMLKASRNAAKVTAPANG